MGWKRLRLVEYVRGQLYKIKEDFSKDKVANR